MSILKAENMMIILYVNNQEDSRAFYEKLLGYEPSLHVPGMTEFELVNGATLGLMPADGIMKILGNRIPHPKEANGIPRCEIYLFVDEPDSYYTKLADAGGTGISRAAPRNWGDTVAYGSDPDGHVLAFAKKQK